MAAGSLPLSYLIFIPKIPSFDTFLFCGGGDAGPYKINIVCHVGTGLPDCPFCGRSKPLPYGLGFFVCLSLRVAEDVDPYGYVL